ncbi:MAG: MoaD/ThiS family protein [Candidatus Woesearchaeota archaeon]|nr:MAG: MoaD/ThiS family protein [Candidatus Woesearchaeota archaeon]
MEVFIERSHTTMNLEFEGSVRELAEKIGVNIVEVLSVKNGEIVPEDEPVNNNDKISFLSVVSGG